MSPVEKALWYVEAHLRQEISLADIAASTGVSRHHLLRAFEGPLKLFRFADPDGNVLELFSL